MPVILISRGTMSGVHLLADRLHDCLGIRCIIREDLEKIVNRHGMLATRIIEKLAKATSAYAQFSELRWPYIVLMRQALLEELRHDNVVYYGYSNHLLMPHLRHFIRVRIEAPLELRVEMTMPHLKCDEEKAREYINEVDDHRVKWARFMYAQDIRNTMQYDLLLNMGHMTLGSACRIIENLMKDPDFQAVSESQSEVECLYQAANVEAALVTDQRTATFEINAEAQKDGGVQLIGPYLDDPEREIVMEVAGSVSGVTHIQYITGYAPNLQIDSRFSSKIGDNPCFWVRIQAPAKKE